MKKLLILLMVFVLAGCAGKQGLDAEPKSEWKCKDLGGLLSLSRKCDQIVKQEPANDAWGQSLSEQEAAEQEDLGLDEAELAVVEEPELTIKEQMMAFDPSMYVVQVVSTMSKDSLDIFLGKNELFQKSYVRTWDKGQAWYVIVFGVYEDYSEAKRVAGEIPANYRSGAWVRTAGSLQEVMRAFDAQQGPN